MDGFRDIYGRHYPAVYRLALFLTGNAKDAEDLTADTFVRAWTARDRRRVQTVRAYLLTITRNLHRDAYRTRGARFVELDDTTPDRRPGADLVAEHASTVRGLRRRLTDVAPGDRCALLLFSLREMSYAEIAKALGVSIAAVKSQLARAREVLRSQVPLQDTNNHESHSQRHF